MEVDPTRVCELLVRLGDVEVLGVEDEAGGPLRVHVRRRARRPGCAGCGGALWSDGERPVELVDLPVFGRAVRLVQQAPLALPAARMRGGRGDRAGRRDRARAGEADDARGPLGDAPGGPRPQHDPLYRARKLLVSASERVTDNGRARLRGLLDAGDPYGEVRDVRRR